MKTEHDIAKIIDNYCIAGYSRIELMSPKLRRLAAMRLGEELRRSVTILDLMRYQHHIAEHYGSEIRDQWDWILHNALLYVGAAAVLGVKNAVLDFGVWHEDAGNASLYDLTLDQLISTVPEIYHHKLDVMSKLKKGGGGRSGNKRHGIDGRKPMKKEVASRLGLSRAGLDNLLKNPDNEWGIKTDFIQSWKALNYYMDTHKDIIDRHKKNPKCKLRKCRAKIDLTKTGDVSDKSQSVTQNYKPSRRPVGKSKK